MSMPTGLAARMRAAAVRFDDRPALHAEHGTWTYAQAEARAHRWAGALAHAGCGQGSRVLVHCTQSPEFITAVRAITEVGAAVVPVDPDYPAARKQLLQELSGAQFVIVADPLGKTAFTGAVLMDVETLDSGEPWQDGAPAHPQRLAWICGTSGSTGRPKAVALTDQGLVGLADAIVERTGLCENDRVLPFAAVGFSVAAEEVLSTWLAGAALVFCRPEERNDPSVLRSFLNRQEVSFVQLTPAYWYELISACEADGILSIPSRLRAVVLGSDAVAPSMVRRWLEGGGMVGHEYGVSEGSVSQLLAMITSTDDLVGGEKAPIGHPLTGSRVYLLDDLASPTAPGATGELYIGGPGLAWGYLEAPGATAERFVPDPLSPCPGGRMYRTGDMAQYHAVSGYVFVGRSDHQLNVAGVRLEPAEVEAALVSCPGVLTAAVGAQRVASGPGAEVLRLVGLVQWAADAGVDPAARVLAALADKLPPTHVPALLVPVDHMPTNAHGKIDRHAVAELLAQPLEVSGTEPRNDLEAKIHAAWCRALGFSRIGVERSLADLGIDSLGRLRLLGVLVESGVRLTQQTLLSHDTIADLAIQLSASPPAAAPATVFAGRGPLSRIQTDLYIEFARQGMVRSANETIVLTLPGVEETALRGAVADVVADQPSLRTRFRRTAAGLVQDHTGGPPALAETRFAASHDELRATLRAEQAQPFDLTREPLARLSLWRLSDDPERDLRLALTTSHLVFDGISMDLFGQQLAAAYHARREGARWRPEPVPSPAGLALLEAERWQRGDFDDEIKYWERRRADVEKAAASQPGWLADRSGLTSIVVQSRQLSAVTASRWRGLARYCGGSVGSVALALFALHLAAAGRGRCVLTELRTSRETVDLAASSMGCLMQSVLVTADLDASETVADYLRRFHAQRSLDSRHTTLPYGMLCDALWRDDPLVRATLAGATFSWRSLPGAPTADRTRWPVEVLALDAPLHALQLEVDPDDAGLALRLSVDARVAGSPEVAGFLDRYMQSVADAGPATSVGELVHWLRGDTKT